MEHAILTLTEQHTKPYREGHMGALRAGVYARKSSDNEQGVSRQIELAKDFIAKQGWTLGPVFSDNDVSGATFDRPGLNRLTSSLTTSPRPFDALVMMDASRLGRDMAETLPLQLRIVQAGVRVFHYQDGQELLLQTPTQKLVASVANYSHEDFRYQIKVKTSQALRKKAAQGHAVGGQVYGYEHVRGPEGVTRVVKEQEANVIRRVFAWVAQGWGMRRIAMALNAEGISGPTGKTWGSTSVREVLKRSLYRGQIVYGTTRDRVRVPKDDWVRVDAPELRIVTPEQAQAADVRMARTRSRWHGHRGESGQVRGRPEGVLASQHLLAGHLRCGSCGGSLFVAPRVKRGIVTRYWLCTRHHKQGNVTCANRHAIPYDALTQAVLACFRGPERAQMIVDALLNEHERRVAEWRAQQGSAPQHEDERRRLQAELGRLVDAVAQGGSIPALVERLRATEVRLEALARVQEAPVEPEHGWVLPVIYDFQQGLESVPTGRQTLAQLLPEPVTVAPTFVSGRHTGWTFEGVGALGRVLAGRVGANEALGRPISVSNQSHFSWAARG